MTARESALLILKRILYDNAYANVALRTQLARQPLPPRDRGLCTELVYGVLRYLNRLEYILKKLSRRPLASMDWEVVVAVYLALYQMIYLDRIPASAAVNESVQLVKKYRHIGSAKFTNAILRNYLRRAKQLSIPTVEENQSAHLALTYGIPQWMVEMFGAQWGPERALETFQEWTSPSPNYLRINTLRKEKHELLTEWEDEHIAIHSTAVPEGVEVTDGDVTRLEHWLAAGEIYWQDVSSMMVAHAVDAQVGEKVLDLCAAPGGKSTHIAALSKNQAEILAADIHPHKVQLIEENAARLGATSVRAVERDATILAPSEVNRYDRVLTDAPCSGLGVIGRRPDVKWRRTKESLSQFPALQSAILDCAAAYVREGGRLVYSTCTLNRDENEAVVENFLARHSEYRLRAFSLPTIGRVECGYLTIWPAEYRSDGFFIAVMEREVRR